MLGALELIETYLSKCGCKSFVLSLMWVSAHFPYNWQACPDSPDIHNFGTAEDSLNETRTTVVTRDTRSSAAVGCDSAIYNLRDRFHAAVLPICYLVRFGLMEGSPSNLYPYSKQTCGWIHHLASQGAPLLYLQYDNECA
jgi:hypothetical protein